MGHVPIIGTTASRMARTDPAAPGRHRQSPRANGYFHPPPHAPPPDLEAVLIGLRRPSAAIFPARDLPPLDPLGRA